jgi:hypothetical protein
VCPGEGALPGESDARARIPRGFAQIVKYMGLSPLIQLLFVAEHTFLVFP